MESLFLGGRGDVEDDAVPQFKFAKHFGSHTCESEYFRYTPRDVTQIISLTFETPCTRIRRNTCNYVLELIKGEHPIFFSTKTSPTLS